MPGLLLLILLPVSLFAAVLSPRAVETRFHYETEFLTGRSDARAAALDHAKYLFSALQNPHIVREFGLRSSLDGIGAPRWEPAIRDLRVTKESALLKVRYRAEGVLLLEKRAAAELLRRGSLELPLPYRLDDYFSAACTDPGHADPEEFWYFADVKRPGCEALRHGPLGQPVQISIRPAPPVDGNASAGLGELRGDNGNGDLFEVMSVNGFDENPKNPRDEGRRNYRAMNEWFREQGFSETIVSRFRNRPVHVFEKTLRRPGGGELRLRVTRLLVDTDLDGSRNVSFAKFLARAFRESDVIVYEGHSGLGANLDLETIERRLQLSDDKEQAKKIEFDRGKRQLFFFDSCSSYSYYLGMFAGRKAPGRLAVLSNGLASLFGYELPVTRRLYRALLQSGNDSLLWSELLEDLESPLRGRSFLLNVDF